MSKRGKTAPDFDYLDQAERELFPTRPYHYLTREQREETYKYAKQLLQQQTGRHIP